MVAKGEKDSAMEEEEQAPTVAIAATAQQQVIALDEALVWASSVLDAVLVTVVVARALTKTVASAAVAQVSRGHCWR